MGIHGCTRMCPMPCVQKSLQMAGGYMGLHRRNGSANHVLGGSISSCDVSMGISRGGACSTPSMNQFMSFEHIVPPVQFLIDFVSFLSCFFVFGFVFVLYRL